MANTDNHKIRVLHIITGLHTGGAEMMLLKLLQQQHNSGYENLVLSIQGEGELTEKIKHHCRDVLSLDIRHAIVHPIKFLGTMRTAHSFKADIIQGWMYHGNMLATLLHGYTNSIASLVWNIRCSQPVRAGLLTRWVRRYCVRSSHRATYIISNSYAGLNYHKAIGYSVERFGVIANGIDTAHFQPDSQRRLTFRRSYNISDNTFLIGIAASYREMKDYGNFFSAIKLFTKKYKNVLFIAAGRDICESNQKVTQLINDTCTSKRVKLLGEISDIAGFMNALDVFTLSSKTGEGFPNVIGEAMACQTPCVVTDVGDSRRIVQNFGITIPVQSAEALAEGWARLYEKPKAELTRMGQSARQHIVRNYQISRIAADYDNLYQSLLPIDQNSR